MRLPTLLLGLVTASIGVNKVRNNVKQKTFLKSELLGELVHGKTKPSKMAMLAAGICTGITGLGVGKLTEKGAEQDAKNQKRLS